MSSPAVQLRSRVPRIAEAAVERARLRVVPRRRTRAARVPFVALVTLVLLGGVVGLLLFNTSMQQAAFATTALEQQATTLTARQQTLEMELDVLRNPQRVAQQAQQLGMVPAGNPAYLVLESGTVLGEPTAATSAELLRLQAQPPPKPAVLDPDPVVRRVVSEGPTAVSLDQVRNEGRPVTRSGD
ncbi:hypothetical protein [Nocardioides coralli]|uniref:hypothetical protein n=1 Tax=Nocardioides coralli TaxID=2872154 RepID=UPI001CA425B7|nr:hypothetical protein [Nocardioides coralli]QZY27964.1 hypothetical protein K6T13_10690 [Nocardioides coralli]